MENNKLNINFNESGNVGDSTSTVFQRPSFRCAYDKPVAFAMPDCPKEIDKYAKRVDKFGSVTYVATGEKINSYEEIQSYADDTDINVIIARCIKDGSTGILAAQASQFVDVTDIPDDFLGIYNLGLQLKNEFDTLAPEVRALFNNSSVLYADSRIKGESKGIIDNFNKLQEEKNKVKVEGGNENV